MVIPPNTIILLDKGNEFSCESNIVTQIKVLRFNTEIFSPSIVFLCGFINTAIKKTFKNHIILCFDNEQTQSIEDVFTTIEQSLKEQDSININEITTVICDLLHNALRERFKYDQKYINCFGKNLNAQFNILHNVSDYTMQLNLNPKNLLRKFQRQGLKNPSEIIK